MASVTIKGKSNSGKVPAAKKFTAGGRKAPRRQSEPAQPAAQPGHPGNVARVVLWDSGVVTLYDAGGDELGTFKHSDAKAVSRVVANAPETCRFTLQKWGQGAKGAKDITREKFAAGL